MKITEYVKDKATGVMESVGLIATASKEKQVEDPENAEDIIKANTLKPKTDTK